MHDFLVHDLIELKRLPDDVFKPMHANRKWTFCTLRPRFWTNSWASRLFKSKDTWQYKFDCVKAYLKRKRLLSGWLAQNVAAFTALFKNTRTLKFKGQFMFPFFAAVNHLSGPLKKQWSVIGGFRSVCVQTPLPSGKIEERARWPLLRFFPRGGGSVHKLDLDPFCVFPCFIVRFWILEFAWFDTRRHIRNPRGRLGTSACLWKTQ